MPNAGASAGWGSGAGLVQGQCCNVRPLWGLVILPETWGDLWGPHGTRLRLQGMAHLPGVKTGSPNCCLLVGLSQGFAGVGFYP